MKVLQIGLLEQFHELLHFLFSFLKWQCKGFIFLRGKRKDQVETTSTNENESEENDIMDFLAEGSYVAVAADKSSVYTVWFIRIDDND